MIVSIDVIVGPLITLAIFNPKKTRQALTFDISIVASVQVLALSYGLWTMAAARPLYMVFEKDLFRIVHASDVAGSALYQPPAGIDPNPITGPSLLAIHMPTDPKAKDAVLTAALYGMFEAYQRNLWVPYQSATTLVLAAAKPVTNLKEQFPSQAAAISTLITGKGYSETQVKSLPVVGRGYLTWTVLLNDAAEPFAYLPLDSSDIAQH